MAARDELLQEYYWIQQRISQFDERQINIKSWSATATAALIGVSFSEHKPELLIVGAILSLVFWYIDAQWKSFQYIAIDHGAALEKAFEEGADAYLGPTIHDRYKRSFSFWATVKRFCFCAMLTNVWLPHLPLALACGVTFALEAGLAARLDIPSLFEALRTALPASR